MNTRRSSRVVWGAPVAIALLSAGGLLFALLGDGLADTLSWLALAVPVAISGWILWPHDVGGSGTR